MMATAATSDTPVVDAPVNSDSQLMRKTEQSTSNGDPASGHLSSIADEAENKLLAGYVDDLVNSAEASISGGSDTEASKHAASRLKNADDKGNARSSSSALKKPHTFKAVSVNKTFLSGKAATGSSPAKQSDKASPPTPSASVTPVGSTNLSARPRLVAKPASGLRDSFSRSAGSLNGKPPAAPDPNAVWNKNRPVPLPEPKNFTDEELKKYGIHMATRLNTDDARKEANWADIDDDDEDWAPETITWTDGTKITIPHADEAAASADAAVPDSTTSSIVRDAKALVKPKSPVPAAGPSSSHPIIKAPGKGLILKGAPEKPTLVAKPPAPPTPVKSPWAPLPPVDKVPPVAMDLPPNQPAPRLGTKETPASKTLTPPPPPAKEIAADDFSRSTWRDSQSHPTRELFNSHSGRYEPVPDRRGSMRSDVHPKQPAVLQRPAHHEMQGPAEPTPSFQTSRTSGQEPPYGRRRGSSNVSGGSGSFLQRFSKGSDQHLPPLEVVQARRDSLAGASDNPTSPRNFSPSGQPVSLRQQGPWQVRASPGTAHAVPHIAAVGPDSKFVAGDPSAPGGTDYEYQKKLMRERREQAVKRRLEEEAREEAARKERIRLKLEAMGPAPERKSEKKEASTQERAPTPATPTQIQRTESSGNPDEPARASNAASSPQLHASSSTTKATLDDHREASPVPLANGSSPRSRSDRTVSNTVDAGVKPQPDTAHGRPHHHPWNDGPSPQADRLSSWGPGSHGPSRNVWGSPGNDRSLGNGTFSSDLGSVGSITSPLATPKPGGDAPSERTAGRIAPIAPPQSSRQQSKQRPGSANPWATAVQDLDQTIAVESKNRREEQDRLLASSGLTLEDTHPSIKETWRARDVRENQPRGLKASQVLHESGPRAARGATGGSGENAGRLASGPQPTHRAASATGPVEDDQRVSSSDMSHTSGTTVSGTTPPARGSRFFPSRDVRLEEPSRPLSPTLPPPTMDDHPAYDGDAARPHVALPPPQPRVRLPPAAPMATARQSRGVATSAPAWSAHHPASGNAYRPAPTFAGAVSRTHDPPASGNWQERINSLFHRPSPPKAMTVDSASKSALEHMAPPTPATVSLPVTPFVRIVITDDNGSMTTKEMSDECFEEQEMGSLPVLKFPKIPPEAAWAPALIPKPYPRKLLVNSTSGDVTFLPDVLVGGHSIRVSIPGMREPRDFPVPFPRTRSNPRRARSGPRQPSSGYRGGKGREQLGSYSNDHGTSSGTHASLSARGSRGGYRGRTDWSRRSTTPLQS